MNKSELIDHVARETAMTRAEAQKALEAVLSGITVSLQNGEETRLTGFGSFAVQNRAARQGRNPRTGETTNIPASKAPKFKPGKELKDAVNK